MLILTNHKKTTLTIFFIVNLAVVGVGIFLNFRVNLSTCLTVVLGNVAVVISAVSVWLGWEAKELGKKANKLGEKANEIPKQIEQERKENEEWKIFSDYFLWLPHKTTSTQLDDHKKLKNVFRIYQHWRNKNPLQSLPEWEKKNSSKLKEWMTAQKKYLETRENAQIEIIIKIFKQIAHYPSTKLKIDAEVGRVKNNEYRKINN